MILVDSSAFIEFYRPGGIVRARQAVARAIADDEAAVNGVIMAEVLSFAPGADAFARLERDFAAFRWLDLARAEFELACRLGRDLRGKGVSVPATDLVIAASAIRAGAVLYHLDRHYDLVAKASELKARNLTGK
ncbi:MAG: PIN domain-containing protein [Deltaproteobacteria bacterium]|nr:PIN domain-containing protein [Deltaproteobacteria bacterium]